MCGSGESQRTKFKRIVWVFWTSIKKDLFLSLADFQTLQACRWFAFYFVCMSCCIWILVCEWRVWCYLPRQTIVALLFTMNLKLSSHWVALITFRCFPNESKVSESLICIATRPYSYRVDDKNVFNLLWNYENALLFNYLIMSFT